MRRGHCAAAGAAAALVMALAPGAATAWSAPTATSAKLAGGSLAAPPLARAAAVGDSEAIAFDDFTLGTTITDDYAAQGVVFTSDVFLTDDNSNPTAPVLSGSPKFFGDIVGHFTVPGTTTPTTVNGFSFDVGYIDDRNSVQIDYYDAAGNVVGSTRAQSFGINRIDVTFRGVAGFKVSAVEYEAAGFAIDNLVVRRGVGGLKPQRVAALGDSYSSGEGLLPEKGLRYDCGTDLREDRYYENTNAPVTYSWQRLWNPEVNCDTRTGSTRRPADLDRRRSVKYRNLCHRHRRAYSQQVLGPMGVSGANSLFVACSGATTEHIGAVDPKWVQYEDSPFGVHGGKTSDGRSGQFATLEDFAKQGNPDLIMIGIGGNDAKFGEIINTCVSITGACDEPDFMSRTISTINGTVFRKLRDTFAALRSRFGGGDDAATIVAFGYPSVIDEPKGCLAAPRVGDGEWSFIKHQLLPTLNSAIEDAAKEAGVVYVDIAGVTANHGICSGDRWINGLQSGNDKWNLIANESFHPNQKAHDAIAAHFANHYTDGAGTLLVANPAPSAPIRPPTGPEIRIGTIDAGAGRGCGASCLQPAACVQACPLHVRGGGFTPGATLQAVVQSDPVTLGTVTADAAGNVAATLQLPRGIAPGEHTLTLSGMTPDGTRQHAVEPLRVYERMATRIVAKVKRTKRAARVRKLTVRGLPAKSRVRIACAKGARAVTDALAGVRSRKRQRRARGVGCPFVKRAFPVKRATAKRAFAKHFKRPLRAGAVVRVLVTLPGAAGRTLDVKVRKGRRAKLTRRCLDPGELRAVRC